MTLDEQASVEKLEARVRTLEVAGDAMLNDLLWISDNYLSAVQWLRAKNGQPLTPTKPPGGPTPM